MTRFRIRARQASRPLPFAGGHPLRANRSRQTVIKGFPCRRPVCALLLSVLFLGTLGVWWVAPLPGDGPLLRALHNFAHFPVFGIQAVAVFLAIRLFAPIGLRRGWRAYLLTLVAMLCISSIAEWSQRFSARDASIDDVFVNMLGSIAALSIAALIDLRLHARTHRPFYQFGLASLATITTLVAVTPLVITEASLAKRNADFPCILCPSSWLDLRLLETNGATADLVGRSDSDGNALLIQLQKGRFPGISMPNPRSDWRGYDALVLGVFNPENSPIRLTLRIDDAQHNYEFADRFNQTIVVPANGLLEECIPLTALENAPQDRLMDLSKIAFLALFGNNEEHGRRFYLHNIRLTGHHRELSSDKRDQPCSVREKSKT